jgi:hypothetical protein
MSTDKIDEMLEGIKAISGFIDKPDRQAYYLCETKQIPAFKLANKWHMRKSSYRRRIEELERSGGAA